MAYEIKFVWSGQALENGELRQLNCDGYNLPWERYLGNVLSNTYMQWRHGEAAHAGTVPQPHSLTVTETQCVMLPAGKFLYMDVGCWLNGDQYFGLVAGSDAHLCTYTPNPAPATASGCTPLNSFLAIPGVKSWKHEKIPAPYPSDSNRVYLILPDMHVPAAPPLDMAKPSNTEGFGPLKRGHWRRDPTLWGELAKRDFFHSRESINAMTEFLSKVASLPAAQSTIFVQLGDMYELWADWPCLFKEVSDEEYYRKSENREPVVELVPGGRHLTTTDVIGGWIAETHEMHWKLFFAFDGCVAATEDHFFLHGNHDSYLSLPEVVNAANRIILEPSAQVLRGGGGQLFAPATNVYPRQRDVLLDGIFIEHGQRYDWANRDGNPFGPMGTQTAINWPPLKALDSVRRKTFVSGAAVWWALSHMNFGLYVQGHTHDPDLKYVTVGHMREDMTWVQMRDREVLHKKLTPIAPSP